MIARAHREVGARVDVDVAVARRGVDHRHRRDRAERLLQALAAARDDQVDDAVLGRELGQLLAAAAGDERERARRAARRPRRPPPRPRRAPRWSARAEDEPRSTIRVAGLQAQRGGVDRDVRPRLVDDGDDAERDAHLAHVEPVGQPAAVDDLADRVGQRGDLAHARGHRARSRARRAPAGPSARRRARSRGRPRGRARWPRGSPGSAPRARRRSRAAPRP